MTGQWQVKAEGLRPLHAQATNLLQRFPQRSVHHIPREGNATADALSNQAMDGLAWEGLRDAAVRVALRGRHMLGGDSS